MKLAAFLVYIRILRRPPGGGGEHRRDGKRCAGYAGFKSLAADAGYQRLVQIYLGYLRDLEAKPPGPEWDAAFTLYDK